MRARLLWPAAVSLECLSCGRLSSARMRRARGAELPWLPTCYATLLLALALMGGYYALLQPCLGPGWGIVMSTLHVVGTGVYVRLLMVDPADPHCLSNTAQPAPELKW